MKAWAQPHRWIPLLSTSPSLYSPAPSKTPGQEQFVQNFMQISGERGWNLMLEFTTLPTPSSSEGSHQSQTWWRWPLTGSHGWPPRVTLWSRVPCSTTDMCLPLLPSFPMCFSFFLSKGFKSATSTVRQWPVRVHVLVEWPRSPFLLVCYETAELVLGVIRSLPFHICWVNLCLWWTAWSGFVMVNPSVLLR